MNLNALQQMLKSDIAPHELAEELDTTIFEFIYLYGLSEQPLSNQVFAEIIYWLRHLRDVFKQTAADNT